MNKPKTPLAGLLHRIRVVSRYHGLKVTLQLLLWSIQTAAQKRWITFQEERGVFTYHRWIQTSDPDPKTLTNQRAAANAFQNKPLVSILIASDGINLRSLRATLNSLAVQSYPHWEAVIAQPGEKPSPELQSLANQFSQSRFAANPDFTRDPLMKAFSDASGELVQALNAGDCLAPDALYEISRAFNTIPACDIIYTDEDEVGEGGDNRRNPFFKPDWSPELFLSTNYLAAAIISQDLLQKSLEAYQAAGELEPSYEDLIFGCIENAHTIHHIPKPLVHVGGYNPQNSKDSPSGSNSRGRILAHLRRAGLAEPEVTCTDTGYVRVGWLTKGQKVSIIIPTTDHISLLKRCLTSIETHTRYPSYELVLVDTNSQENETLDFYTELKSRPDVRIVFNKEKFNFNKVLNLGAHHARGEIFLFLNNDTEAIEPGWLTELVRWADRSEVGVVGGKLLFPGGTIQHAGIVFGLEGHASHVFGGEQEGHTGPFGSVDWYRNYAAVTAACMAVRRDVFEKIGGFDEDYLLVFSDIEFCLRAHRAGYRIVYTPYARLIHHEGKTRYRHIPSEDIRLATAHFRTLIAQGDPYFNPNLSHTVRSPTLRRPWEELPLSRLEKITLWRGGSFQ